MITFSHILSKMYRAHIECQRVFDHTWRHITGAPTLAHSQVTPSLYLGGQHTLRGLKRLHQRGVTAVVNMRMQKRYDLSSFTWLQTLHLPTPDQKAPSIAQLMQGIEFIEQEIANGGAVYVHCKSGEGRGPTMAVAYLMSTGLSQEDALALVQKTRAFAHPTPEQQKQLTVLERTLRAQQLGKLTV